MRMQEIGAFGDCFSSRHFLGGSPRRRMQDPKGSCVSHDGSSYKKKPLPIGSIVVPFFVVCIRDVIK